MGMPSDSQVGDLMDKRSGNGTRGFAAQKTIWSAILPVWEMESGKITSVTLHPIDLHQHDPRSRKGSPTLTDSDEALHHLKELSREFGTDIQIKNGKGYIDMAAEA